MKPVNLLYIFADQWRAHGIGAAGRGSGADTEYGCICS